MENKSYKDLIVWQKSMILTERIYIITKGFPQEELYGLVSQLRRSAISIPSNIAEGEGRKSEKEFNHFLQIALGSLCELETQLILSEKLRYINHQDNEDILKLCIEIGKLINGLRNSINH